MPCCCCGLEYGVVSHHLLRNVTRGMGRKADDCFVIPLCTNCHRMLHDNGNETAFLASHGIDGKALADELYNR